MDIAADLSTAEPVYVVHERPLGRQAPYYLAFVDLAYSGLPGQHEQLWLNDAGDGTFRVACVPFCAYGIAYADRVRLDPAGRYVSDVAERSTNRVLRYLVDPAVDDAAALDLCAEVERLAAALDIAGERHGDRFHAFTLATGDRYADLVEMLERERRRGTVHWEWGDLIAFPA